MRIHIASIGTEPEHEAQRRFLTDLAARDEIGVHRLAASAESADGVLFVDLHQHPDDPYLHSLRAHPLVRRFGSKTFVLDQRDTPTYTWPGIYVSASRRWRRSTVRGGPYPVLPNAPNPREAPPTLLFSFMGARTHPVRERLLAITHPRAIVEDTSDTHTMPWLTGPQSPQTSHHRFATVLQRSKFVLCPRGHGPSSFRLYEALSAGRVPVVISDGWLAPPGVAWNGCTVRVPERQADDVVEILEAAEPGWPAMAACALDVWDKNFRDGRLWHHYAESLEELSRIARRAAQAPWWMQEPVLRIAARRALARVRRSDPRLAPRIPSRER